MCALLFCTSQLIITSAPYSLEVCPACSMFVFPNLSCYVSMLFLLSCLAWIAWLVNVCGLCMIVFHRGFSFLTSNLFVMLSSFHLFRSTLFGFFFFPPILASCDKSISRFNRSTPAKICNIRSASSRYCAQTLIVLLRSTTSSSSHHDHW